MLELTLITRHAATVLVGQLAVMAYGVTDTIVAGRYSPQALAALSVASAIFISVYVTLLGVFQALLPLWAEQRGAGNGPAMGRSVRQSLYLCLGASTLGVAVLLWPDALLHYTQVPDLLQSEVKRYLAVLSLALPLALLFRIYSTLNQALGQPRWVTWLQVAALGVKIPLSVWFTFGGAGLAPQGVVGCAWATLAVNLTLLVLALLRLKSQALYAPMQLWQRVERPDPAQLRAFLRLGIPAGLSLLVEVTSFTLMALFIARQGVLAAGSHQIASNLAAVLYMVPLSLGIATSARVSYWRGAGQQAQAQRVAWLGLRTAALMGCALGAAVFLAKRAIAAFYNPDTATVALASALLGWVALYHVADALQTLCVFILRSYRVTVVPLLLYGVLLWGAGLMGGYYLTYHSDWPAPTSMPTPVAFWIASALALGVTAVLFTALLAWVLGKTPPSR